MTRNSSCLALLVIAALPCSTTPAADGPAVSERLQKTVQPDVDPPASEQEH